MTRVGFHRQTQESLQPQLSQLLHYHHHLFLGGMERMKNLEGRQCLQGKKRITDGPHFSEEVGHAARSNHRSG